MRCLILDDDKTFCYKLRALLLREFATEVHLEFTYKDALVYLRRCQVAEILPDLFFCDFKLDGPESGLALLQSLAAEQMTIPTILLTDYQDAKIITEVEKLGAQHVTKTALESGDLLRQISLFAFRSWAEQRRIKEAQLKRHSQSILLLGAEIAHEFTSVIISTRNQFGRIKRHHLANALTPDTMKKFTEELNDKIRDGLRLGDLLMTYGALKKHKPSFDRVDLLETVKDIVENDDSAGALHIKYAEEGPQPDNNTIVDRFIVGRALTVLLKNALHHCGRGTQVQITVGAMHHDGAKVAYIDFEDNGPGVARELREIMFEPGERCGKEIRHSAGSGLGLGLSIARVLIELHRTEALTASIRCIEPTSLSGARFRIILPQP